MKPVFLQKHSNSNFGPSIKIQIGKKGGTAVMFLDFNAASNLTAIFLVGKGPLQRNTKFGLLL